MTTTDTTPELTADDVDELTERYVAMWNEPDVAARRAAIDGLWADDAFYANSTFLYRGHDEIARGVSRSHDQWVGSGHHFRSAGRTASHHGTVRFTWDMVGPDGNTVVSVGTSFMTVAADGRIASDLQYAG